MAKSMKSGAAGTKTVGINIGINIGISEKDRSAIAGGLSKLLADKAGDEPTADLLTQRLTVHEQTAWMLRSLLET